MTVTQGYGGGSPVTWGYGGGFWYKASALVLSVISRITRGAMFNSKITGRLAVKSGLKEEV